MCVTEFIGDTILYISDIVQNCITNKLSYAHWNVSKLIGTLLCLTETKSNI
jgi:hypothetical protein